MNAQEALNELRRMAIRYEEEVFGLRTGDVDVMTAVIQQLIDQANAKPKTLEELDWRLEKDTDQIVIYRQNAFYLTIIKGLYEFKISWVDNSDIEHSALIDMELVKAIQQKMKELGMTEKEVE